MLDLPGVPAQLGLFDGLGYEPPAAVVEPDDPAPPRVPIEQLGFEFEPGGGEQITFDEWHSRFKSELTLFASRYPRGKTRRKLRKKAKRCDACGKVYRRRVCHSCGAIEAKEYVASNCENRACPASARADALELRSTLFSAVRASPYERRGRRMFLHTITVRRPSWTTIERLRVDRNRAMDGWRAAWKLLRKIAGGQWAYLRIEVSPGGMVHAHVLAYHRYVSGQRFEELRAAVLAAIGGETTQYRVVPAKKNAVKEVGKYVCKGVAMNHESAHQTHPRLAAMVEAAFLGRRLGQEYGDMPAGNGEVEPESEWHCSMCGGENFSWQYIDRTTGDVVEVAEVPRAPP